MPKNSGYYIASIAGAADPSVILYFDGKEMWAPGNADPIDEKYLLFVDSEPFDHRAINSGSEFQSADEWFKQAS